MDATSIFIKYILQLSIVVFWVVTPCGLVGGHQRFGGTYRLHLQAQNFTFVHDLLHFWRGMPLICCFRGAPPLSRTLRRLRAYHFL
jgi:hypothetical protein